MRTADPGSVRVPRILPLAALAALAAAVLAGCGGGGGGVLLPTNALPQGITQRSVTSFSATTVGSGATAETQDLLTGGIGKTGLAAGTPPAYVDPSNPTALELRRNALHSNYRGLLDPSVNGGFTRLYGPNVAVDGTVTNDEGLIPGREYIATLDDGSGRKNVVIAVQIPDAFNQATPCIVLGPSSGSRGVYGAIGTAGEWGLKHGCAVALTDAGKGIGLHDLGDDTVNTIDGPRATRAQAGTLAQFAANITEAARTAFNAVLPDRFALKHAHSQQNPERDWGSDTLASARYALFALNDRFGTAANPVPFRPQNTIVIAGSASNGGAAVLRAAELDANGLIDGVVASEPVTEIPGTAGFAILFDGAPVAGFGKTLAEYVTAGNLYQPCAALADNATLGAEPSFFNFMLISPQLNPAGSNQEPARNRCAGLAARGLVSGATLAAQANDALAKLHALGWTAENDQMHNAHWGLGNGPILSAMYPLAYGRFSVVDQVCGTSFAVINAATGDPIAPSVVPTIALQVTQSFAVANGTANGTPVTPVYDKSAGGPKSWQFAQSTAGVRDFGLETALCQRALVTGTDPVTGAALSATATDNRPSAAQSAAVRAGIAEVLVNGDLRRKPTLIVAGRSDALVPVNNNARAYTALNRAVEGAGTGVRYIEVTNAQHFDTFISLPGFDTRFVPLHVYFNQAMDHMWDHLRQGTALPPSQVVHTTPRGGVPGQAPPLAAANIPPISATPAAADLIGFDGNAIAVPR